MGSQDQSAGPMKRARLAAGQSVADVASKLCKSARTIERYDSGESTPPQHVMLRLAKLYGVSPADLVGVA